MSLFRKKPTNTPHRRQGQSDTDTTSSDLSRRYLRNRTLSQAPVEAPEQSEREHVHKLTSLRRRIILVFGLIIGISGGLLLLLTQFSAQVTIGVTSATIKPADASV